MEGGEGAVHGAWKASQCAGRRSQTAFAVTRSNPAPGDLRVYRTLTKFRWKVILVPK